MDKDDGGMIEDWEKEERGEIWDGEGGMDEEEEAWIIFEMWFFSVWWIGIFGLFIWLEMPLEILAMLVHPQSKPSMPPYEWDEDDKGYDGYYDKKAMGGKKMDGKKDDKLKSQKKPMDDDDDEDDKDMDYDDDKYSGKGKQYGKGEEPDLVQ